MGKGSGRLKHHCLGLITCSTVPKKHPQFTEVSPIGRWIRKHLS